MKLFYSILLLLCIITKPVYFAGYVGYFELNKEYIIKKYCVNKAKPILKCNGKCHLSKKFANTHIVKSSSESQFKALLSGFKNIFTPLYYTEESNELDLLVVNEYKNNLIGYLTKDYSFYPSTTSPPPKL